MSQVEANLLVAFDFSESGECRIAEFHSMHSCAPSSVRRTLGRMVEKGIIERHHLRRAANTGPRVVYRMTELGKRLRRALEAAENQTEEEDYVHDRKGVTSKSSSSRRARIRGRARIAAGW